jgi:DICT domain-containing protein
MAMFKALRCEDGLILERGAYWIGIARAWSDGRPPAKETDEPKAYEDLEREFDALWQLHAGNQVASEHALPDWVSRRQGAQPPLQLAPGSACTDIATAAVAADARNRDSRPVEKGPGQ